MMRNIWPSHVSASPYVADLDFEEAIDSAIELARLSGHDDGADQAKPVGDESPPVSSREQLDCSLAHFHSMPPRHRKTSRSRTLLSVQEMGADRIVGSHDLKRQNISPAKHPLRRRFADMRGGASART